VQCDDGYPWHDHERSDEVDGEPADASLQHGCGCTSKRGCARGAKLFRLRRSSALASHLEETMLLPRAPGEGAKIGSALAELRQANRARALAEWADWDRRGHGGTGGAT
jgi:hypothetical protein